MLGCQNTTTRQIAEYAGRPHMDKQACVANDDGTCFELSSGDEKEVEGMFCREAILWNDMQNHLERIELFYWRCKKFGRCK